MKITSVSSINWIHFLYNFFWNTVLQIIEHPAGTSTNSDKCDLSKDSDMAPLTLGSMENTTYFYFTQETYFSKYLGEIYIWKNL